MTIQIGEAAGKVWHFLNANPQSTFEQAYKSLAVEPTVFYMAVGWLSREDKITFDGEGRKRTLCLKRSADEARQ